MDARTLSAVAAAHGLSRALAEFDPEAQTDPMVTVELGTAGDDTIRWTPVLSEVGVERLTRLLRAAAPMPAPASRRPRHLRVVGEAS
jgi:hypothetical protein